MTARFDVEARSDQTPRVDGYCRDCGQAWGPSRPDWQDVKRLRGRIRLHVQQTGHTVETQAVRLGIVRPRP